MKTNYFIMQFENINDSKFNLFSGTEVAFSNALYGGYKGETNKPNASDQIKSGGELDETANGSMDRNDGFR